MPVVRAFEADEVCVLFVGLPPRLGSLNSPAARLLEKGFRVVVCGLPGDPDCYPEAWFTSLVELFSSGKAPLASDALVYLDELEPTAVLRAFGVGP